MPLKSDKAEALLYPKALISWGCLWPHVPTSQGQGWWGWTSEPSPLYLQVTPFLWGPHRRAVPASAPCSLALTRPRSWALTVGSGSAFFLCTPDLPAGWTSSSSAHLLHPAQAVRAPHGLRWPPSPLPSSPRPVLSPASQRMAPLWK